MVYREQSISLNGLRFYAYHGAEPQEAVVGAWYTVSVALKTDASAAISSDNLDGTISYALVADVIKKQMQIRSKLLEHVAGRIAQALMNEFGSLNAVRVTVCKENPPVGIPCRQSGFSLLVER